MENTSRFLSGAIRGLGAVNASGTLTMYGGCRVRRSAVAAMAEISGTFVDIDEYLGITGTYIADRLGVEAAVVTAGASPGIMISVAACIAGTDPWMRNRLPSDPPGKRDIIVMRSHRNPYDNAVPTAGGRFVEIGDAIRTHPWELEGAITADTAAVFFALHAEMLQASLSLDETIEIAHRHGLPVIVDAAAELPPKSNLWNLARRGADFVIFSGGKEIAGPQASGLVVGSKKAIEGARYNGSPFYGVGRPCKAGKENIAGFVAALDEYLREDEDTHMKSMAAIRDSWVRELSAFPGIEAGVFVPTQPGMHPVCIPKAFVRPAAGSLDAAGLQARLKAGEPRVIVDKYRDMIVLNPQTIRDDEAGIVVAAIKKALG